MAVFPHILGVIREPAEALRHIKKSAKYGQTLIVLVVGLVISSIISAITAIAASNSADSGSIFLQTFAYDFGGTLVAFLAFIFVAHWFFRTLEHNGSWKKLLMLETYPFVTFKTLTGVFALLATLAGGGSTALDAGAIIGFVFTFFAILLSIYAVIVYVLAARENYGASMALCTVIIIAASLLTFYLSLLSLVNLAGLTGGSPIA